MSCLGMSVISCFERWWADALFSYSICTCVHSTKLGLLEDLEDMRREEEEKLKKLGKLKAKKPRLK